ncbi:MAG: amidohydrolase family protein [Lunatimonas sp.]|uniref:amidohydrolase family protein n=1 Tax=Lunatimonas sp. TaxID=2060141 RepID=UPI00263B4AC4|nr:amidohydrolase family protein [Lunatimonas sp.]MCC5936370.1 amidohydrolase family protein [Lunatimonas sp.]
MDLRIPLLVKIPVLLIISWLFGGCGTKVGLVEEGNKVLIKPVNLAEMPMGEGSLAITHVHVLDVRTGNLLPLHTIWIRDGLIESVFPDGTEVLPGSVEVVDGAGRYVIPGLIDVHFHLDQLRGLPHLFLKKGITALRDPGAWIEAYGNERRRGEQLPRLYLTGPHLDMFPPAHPKDALIIRDEEEARQQVRNLVGRGASAIKIYYRMSLGLIQAAADECKKLGVPSTAHLEISDVREVIRAGVTGIEHVTSFGLALISPIEAEVYRQKVLADNHARREGRYEMWSGLDFGDKRNTVKEIFDLMKEKEVFFCPTLAVFEVGEESEDEVRGLGFQKMMEFTALAYGKGVDLTVGSHSYVPYASYGSAYQREMELMHACGMSLADLIRAATWGNARFLGAQEEIGSIEPGKKADLVLLSSNPLEHVKNLENVEKVMLNGVWVD